MHNNYLKAICITSFGVLLLSLESLFIKISTIEAFAFSFYIGIFMLISINFILIITKKNQVIKIYTDNLKPIIMCGALLGLSNIFFVSSIKATTVANTVMIVASAPLFSALFAYLLYKEQVKRKIFIVSFFIFVGLFIIFSSQLDSGDFIGNIYALICTIFFALAFVILTKYTKANRLPIIAFSGFVTSILTLLFIDSFYLDYYNFIILIITGTIFSPIARVLMGIGAKSLPASES